MSETLVNGTANGSDQGTGKVIRRQPGFNRRRLTVNRTIGDELAELSQDDDKLAQHRKSRLAHPALASCQEGEENIMPRRKMSCMAGAETTEKDKFLPFFADKPMNFFGEDKINELPLGIGLVCHRGHKPESPNQDDYFFLVMGDWYLYGVFDGHGVLGHHVSHAAQDTLPKLIVDRLGDMTGEVGPSLDQWQEIATSSFEDMHRKFQSDYPEAAHSGTTATIVLHCPQSLHVAWVGDSSAALATRPRGSRDSSSWQVRELVDCHKPTRPDEKARIIAAGGSVSEGAEDDSCARLVTPEVGLAMSRALADLEAIPFGLSHVPECIEVIFEPEEDTERIILVCSDGVWDFLSAIQAVQLINKYSAAKAQDAAEKLVQKAQHRWQEHEDVVDDITCLLLWSRDSTDTPASTLASPRGASKETSRPSKEAAAKIEADEEIAARAAEKVAANALANVS